MTHEKENQIYTEGLILAARIELEAMLVENEERREKGYTLAYNSESFFNLLNEYGLSPNGLLSNLRDGL